MRKYSILAPDWWDYTTLDDAILQRAARLTERELLGLSREGFRVTFHETLAEFYLAEALEYLSCWRQATADNPVGICGPIGPTEQLPLVARLVNELGLSLRDAHFWAMDEWCLDGKEVDVSHPLSFRKANHELCFDRIAPALRMPPENMHFPGADVEAYVRSWDGVRCAVMQGGQGDIKHWAFNDPAKRQGPWADEPPPAETYRQLSTRVVDLHPVTIMQNARTSGGGVVTGVPTQAITVGPVQTWQADKVSIWQAGRHDNPFGMRLTALMIAERITDSSVPMSLLADHPNVEFHYYRPALGTCAVDMH
ncbi:MAG: hypothetical protein JW810_03655 [Sedimentisphaerales bacterium]|nr:hypothetical protein [Sedimentisphaerales bacterium]